MFDIIEYMCTAKNIITERYKKEFGLVIYTNDIRMVMHESHIDCDYVAFIVDVERHPVYYEFMFNYEKEEITLRAFRPIGDNVIYNKKGELK